MPVSLELFADGKEGGDWSAARHLAGKANDGQTRRHSRLPIAIVADSQRAEARWGGKAIENEKRVESSRHFRMPSSTLLLLDLVLKALFLCSWKRKPASAQIVA